MKLRGWIICKLRDEDQSPFDDLAQAAVFKSDVAGLSQRVFDLCYGTLSLKDTPPAAGWVFLAKDAYASTVAKGFSVEERAEASTLPIKLHPIHISDESVGARHDPFAGLDGYLVSNSPIASINGTYLKAGMFDEVPMYRHVRGWVILRDLFPEIPELGITTADVEDSSVGFNKFIRKAELSFQEILADKNPVTKYSADFASKFIDIARAGTKMVTADQTLQNLYDNDRRIALQSKASSALMDELCRLHTQFTVDADDPKMPTTVSDSGALPSTAKGPLPGGAHTEVDAISQESARTLGNDVELDMVLTKRISYQSSATPLAAAVLPGASAGTATSAAWSAEGEIASEVVACIEKREIALRAVQLKLAEVQRLYLEEGLQRASQQMENVESLLHDLRLHTLDFSEAYGAWARLVLKQEATQKKIDNKQPKILFPLGVDERTYCVVVAFRGVNELYPASEEMQSSSKRFSRGYQPGVKAVESKYIGEFKTEQEAVEALEIAMRGIADEQILADDLKPEKRVSIGRRPCGKHYLVRNSGVSPDIRCEACQARDAANTDTIAPRLYKNTKGFPVFSWRNENYVEKIWRDCSALSAVDILKKLCPDLELSRNPLILDSVNLSDVMATILQRPGTSEGLPRKSDPLHHLKGRMEILNDALSFSKTYREQLVENERVRKVRSHPYQRTQMVPAAFESSSPATATGKLSKKKAPMDSRMMMSASAPAMRLPKSLALSAAESELYSPRGTSRREVSGIPFDRLTSGMKVLTQILGKQDDDEKNSTQQAAAAAATGAAMLGRRTETMPLPDASFGYASGIDTLLGTQDSYSAMLGASRSAVDAIAVEDSVPTQVVTSFFTDRGAQLALTSHRPLPAHREDDKFARTDVGEFAHMTKGRAVRQFDYKEHQFEANKVKERQRKHLQLLLRQAVAERYHRIDIGYVVSLIDQAKEVRGSVLQLDIAQAHNYILKYHSAVRFSVKAQSIFRGNKDRAVFRRVKAKHQYQHEHTRLTGLFSYEVAKQLIPCLLEGHVQREKRKRCRAVYRFVINMSGFLVVVSVYEAGREMRKPVQSLCVACQAQTVRRHHNGDVRSSSARSSSGAGAEASSPSPGLAKKGGTVGVQEHPLAATRGHIHPEKPAVEHSVCMCQLLQPPETWRVAFYFPLERRTVIRRYTVADIQKLLLYIDESKGMQGADEAYRRLEGESFRELTPLFGPNPAAARGEVEHLAGASQKAGKLSKDPSVLFMKTSFTKAWLFAAKESSVLPRLRTRLPDSVGAILRHCAQQDFRVDGDDEQSLAQIYQQASSIAAGGVDPSKSLKHSQYHNGDLDLPEASGVANSQSSIHCWEPLLDMERSSLAIQEMRRLLSAQETKLVELKRERDEDEAALATGAVLLEHAAMKSEDLWAILLRIDEQVRMENERNLRILQFERDLKAHTSALEANILEDFTRSYDELERADLYLELHKKSKILVALGQQAADVPQVMWAARQAFDRHSLLRAKWRGQCVVVQDQSSLVAKLSCQLRERQEQLHHQREDLRRSAFLMFSVYSLPKSFVEHRQISIFPIHLVFMRKPLFRLKKEYRKALSAVYREAVTIRSGDAAGTYVRCLVSFYIDDVTKNFVVQVAGQNNHTIAPEGGKVVTEESCQYRDFNLDRAYFSPILAHSEPNDIIITAPEMREVLRYNPHYYHGDVFVGAHNRFRELRRTENMCILPSEAPRVVSYVRTMASTASKLSGDTDVDTYLQRQAAVESGDVDLAKKLVQHMRLHLFTSRVCMGMLHFVRRRALVEAVLHRSVHFTDQRTHSPLFIDTPYNSIHSHMHCFNQQRVLVQMHQFLHRFEVTAAYCTVDGFLPVRWTLRINIRKLIANVLNHHQPLRLLAILRAFTTLDYSAQDVQRTVLDNLMFGLPGQLQTRHFRQQLRTEVPALAFNLHKTGEFKPLLSFNRFILNKYIFFTVLRNLRGDLIFELARPRDGKFSSHRFAFNAVKLHLSAHEIMALLLASGRIDLLHPDTCYELISHLVDSIAYVNFQESQRPLFDVSHSAKCSIDLRGVVDTALHNIHRVDVEQKTVEPTLFHSLYTPFVQASLPPPDAAPLPKMLVVPDLPGLVRGEALVLDITLLKYFICQVLDQFNSWRRARHPSDHPSAELDCNDVPEVPVQALSLLLDQINDYLSEPRYILRSSAAEELDMNGEKLPEEQAASNSSVQMVNVYSKIWAFPLCDSPQTVAHGEDPVFATIRATNGIGSPSAAAAPPLGDEALVRSDAGTLNVTYLHSEVYASVDKAHVSVKVSNLNPLFHSREIEDMSLERDREMFALEDHRSTLIVAHQANKARCLVNFFARELAGQRALQRHRSYQMIMQPVYQRREAQNAMRQVLFDAYMLAGKALVVDLLMQLQPHHTERLRATELRRDVHLAGSGAVGDAFEGLSRHWQTLAKVFSGPLPSLASELRVVVVASPPHLGRRGKHGDLRATGFVDYQQTVQHAFLDHHAHNERHRRFRDPEIWHPHSLRHRDPQFLARRRRDGSYFHNGMLYHDSSPRVLPVNDEKSYLLREASVSEYGVALLRLTDLDSNQEYAVHLLPGAPAPNSAPNAEEEKGELLQIIHRSICTNAQPDHLAVQLSALSVLRAEVTQLVARAFVQKVVVSGCALHMYNQCQPDQRRFDDDEQEELEEELLEVLQDAHQLLARHRLPSSRIANATRWSSSVAAASLIDDNEVAVEVEADDFAQRTARRELGEDTSRLRPARKQRPCPLFGCPRTVQVRAVEAPVLTRAPTAQSLGLQSATSGANECESHGTERSAAQGTAESPMSTPTPSAPSKRMTALLKRNTKIKRAQPKEMAVAAMPSILAEASKEDSDAEDAPKVPTPVQPLFAFGIPEDEGIDATPFEIVNLHAPIREPRTFPRLLCDILGLRADQYIDISSGAAGVHRLVLRHAIVFFRALDETQPRNDRLYKLADALHGAEIATYGQPVCRGACVVLLRMSRRSLFEDVQRRLQDLMRLFLPVLRLRKQKEGRETQFRVQNHHFFRSSVYDVALVLEGALTDFFNRTLLHASQRLACAPEADRRRRLALQLLCWHDDHRAEVDVDRSELIDTQLMQEKPQLLLLFENPLQAVPVTLQGYFTHPYASALQDAVMRSDENAKLFEHAYRPQMSPSISTHATTVANESAVLSSSAPPPHFSPAQVVYAVYQLHCYKCRMGTQLCRFPGCAAIRGAARAALLGDSWLDCELPVCRGDQEPSLGQTNIPFSGGHSLDVAIKGYLASQALLSPALRLDEGLDRQRRHFNAVYPFDSAEKEVLYEHFLSRQAIYQFHLQRHLRLDHRACIDQLHCLRVLQRLLLTPEQRANASLHQILQAEGGLDVLELYHGMQDLVHRVKLRDSDEAEADRDSLPFLSVLRASAPALPAHIELAMLTNANDLKNKDDAVFTGNVPMEIIRRLVGGTGIAAHLADPYPDTAGSSRRGPMPDLLYALIMKRVVLAKKTRAAAGLLSRSRARSRSHSRSRSASRSRANSIGLSRSRSRDSEEDEAGIPATVEVTVHTAGRKLVQSAGRDLQEMRQILRSDSELAFDRLLQERVITLKAHLGGDSDVVIVQVLYGTAHRDALMLTDALGVPAAALRFVAAGAMSTLAAGLTIAVYDFRSRVSRAVYVVARDIRLLLRVVNAPLHQLRRHHHSHHLRGLPANVGEEDYAAVARILVFYSPLLLRMQRVGGFCTGVELDLPAVGRLFHTEVQALGSSLGSTASEASADDAGVVLERRGRSYVKVAHVAQRMEALQQLFEDL